ncbi:hypothetical protein FVR03_02370 [Pontibacter qinzhouensis]|uniref:Type 1 periplasmic binding fold superfamily protein n=1 Tax=Pontibacter qinzhouensis TaxID=2603253 RepID=A0A5C8KER6_9BACT|nr:hypothetical protein [Pontibacter qinzhouensis]TXK51949.1 hypothetical protein FVR03_02370 [Pontibacter qinzhouensis]
MNQTYFLSRLFLFILSGVVLLSGCKKSSPAPTPEDEKEIITTVVLLLVPEGKGQNASATWKDPDGPDGQAPSIENLVLKANTTYRGTLTLLNESSPNTPVDITAEVRTEGHDHEVFYVVDGASLAITKTDLDRNNRPIGLETTMATTLPSAGSLRIVLKHQPGLKRGNSTIETGETDVDVVFPVLIQD